MSEQVLQKNAAFGAEVFLPVTQNVTLSLKYFLNQNTSKFNIMYVL